MHRAEPPSGRIDGQTHLFGVRVYYEDTDLSGVVYHANYLRWFERARSDLLRCLDIDQRAAHEAGEGAFAVTSINLRYASPARLDDAVAIATRLEVRHGASFTLLQEAFRDATLLCSARVRVAFVTPGGRPRRLPPAWQDALATLLDPSGTAPAMDLEKAQS